MSVRIGSKVSFDTASVVAFCRTGRHGPDGKWQSMGGYRREKVQGTVSNVIRTDATDRVLGSGLYVSEPFGELLAVKLDKPIRSWGLEPDFTYVAIHQDALATFWQRLGDRIAGRRSKRFTD